MADRDDIMNQEEAARYIASRGIPMVGSRLSRLTNDGDGPDYTRAGYTKIFFRSDVDAWIEKELERRRIKKRIKELEAELDQLNHHTPKKSAV